MRGGGGGVGGTPGTGGAPVAKRGVGRETKLARKLAPSELQLWVPAQTQVGRQVPVTVTVRPRQTVQDAEVTLVFSNGLTAKHARTTGALREKTLGRWTSKPNETVRLPLRLTASAVGTQSVQVRVVSQTATGQQSGKLRVTAAPQPATPAGVEYRFQGADLRRVLQNLGRRIGKQVILAPEVTGELTYTVTDPDPEKVLRDICARRGLKVTEVGRELHIAPMPKPGG